MSITGQEKQFALGAALGEAFRYGFTRIPRILKITWPMYLAMIAIFAVHTVLFTLVWPVTQEELQTNSALFQRHIALNLAIAIAYGLVQVALFVVVVRDYLLAEPHPWNGPAYGSTVLRSIGLLLLLASIGAAIALPVVVAGELIIIQLGATSIWPRVVLLLGVAIAVFYILSRLSTWVTSRAVEMQQTLGESWQATRGAGLKLMAGFLIQLLFFIVVFVIVIIGSGLLLYTLDQIPSLDRQPVTVGYVVVGLIQYVLGLILSAIGSVYLANVLKQTQA